MPGVAMVTNNFRIDDFFEVIGEFLFALRILLQLCLIQEKNNFTVPLLSQVGNKAKHILN